MKLNGKTLAIAAGLAVAAWVFRDQLRGLANKAIWSGGL